MKGESAELNHYKNTEFIRTGSGIFYGKYTLTGNDNGTTFDRIMKNDNNYIKTAKDNDYTGPEK